MGELAEKFYKWAEKSGWNVEFSDKKRELPKNIVERYEFIPCDWIDFICSFKSCANGADNIWFNLPGDFEDGGNDTAFRWNEFELISLGAAAGDDALQSNIRGFWNKYLPIIMSVAGGYHYYAIGIKTGEIFEGRDPEFEEIEICAMNFTDFIEKIISGKIFLS